VAPRGLLFHRANNRLARRSFHIKRDRLICRRPSRSPVAQADKAFVRESEIRRGTAVPRSELGAFKRCSEPDRLGGGGDPPHLLACDRPICRQGPLSVARPFGTRSSGLTTTAAVSRCPAAAARLPSRPPDGVGPRRCREDAQACCASTRVAHPGG
jgi:hypothetical protein